MIWSSDFSIGVPLIDAQHQALFNGIERIFQILEDHEADRDRRMTQDAVFFLEQHALRHFADEEAYMQSINDASLPSHKAQHEAILIELAHLKQDIVASNYSPRAIRKLLGTMLSWLIYHTREVDRLIGKEKIKIDTTNVAAVAVEKAFTQVLNDMLQINPVLANEAYDGSFYGNELPCVVHGTINEETFYLLFAVDQQLIQHSVGKMLGTTITETDDLVLSAFEELCKVLSIHFVKHYRSNAFFNIQQATITTEDQITTLLPSNECSCSMLFNDPYGSFWIRIWEV